MRESRPFWRVVISTVTVVVVAVAAAVLLKYGPSWLVTVRRSNPGYQDDLSSARNAFLAVAAGLLGIVGAVYTAKTLELGRQGHITERFTRAIDQIGSDKVEVRVGGIYALERLAIESKFDRPTILEVLAAYVREHAPAPQQSAAIAVNAVRERIATDVQASLSVIGRFVGGTGGQSVDLSGMELSGASLARGDNSYANFSGSVLNYCDLSGASLEGADFGNAQLLRADLTGARLKSATFEGAFLGDANLTRADLSKAVLRHVNLDGAILRAAHLESTNFFGSSLRNAVIWEAKTHDTNMWNADMAGADVNGTDMTEMRVNAATVLP